MDREQCVFLPPHRSTCSPALADPVSSSCRFRKAGYAAVDRCVSLLCPAETSSLYRS